MTLTPLKDDDSEEQGDRDMSVSGLADAQHAAHAPAWLRWLRARAALIFGILVFVVALVALHHLLAEFQYREVTAHLRALPAVAIVGAVAFTVLSYLTLAGYDLSALPYVGARLPFRTVLYASFTGYALSNNPGLPM